MRSSTRPYPHDEEEIEGLAVEDIDGDGRILQMRIPDPNGLWKTHPDEPRLMIRRDPVETGGTYYRLLPEGAARKLRRVHAAREKAATRDSISTATFPASWRQEFEQLGAGPYPTSEPEVRAVVDFIVRHPNITGGTTFHTWSGVLLRPFEHLPDEEMDAEDLWVYQAVGRKGTELTGYPNISVYHEFRYHPKSVIGGTFDWIYEHLGLFSWVVEIWSPMREAGITDYKYIDWFRDHPVEDDLKLIRWSDAKLSGLAHMPDGSRSIIRSSARVEIGGWNRFHAFSQSAARHARARARALSDVARLAGADLAAARARSRRAPSTSVRGAWKVTLVVAEHGLAAGVCVKRALARKVVRGVIAEIELPQGAKLVAGKPRDELGTARRQGLQAHRRLVLARLPRHRRPDEDRVGRAAARPATW